MTDREKITEILKAYTKKHNISASVVILEEYAEELLANGVIVPPCKVGDIVYEINTNYPKAPFINRFVVIAFHITSGKNILGHKKPSHAVVGVEYMPSLTKRIYLENFGKDVFLTKEDAEEKLKELGKDG